MRKVALLLALCMLLSVLSGCTFEIPSISEAKSVVEAYAYYNLTGELSPDIIRILESNLDDDNGELGSEFEKITKKTPIKVLEKALKAPKKSDMISLAKQYYDMTYPNIEGDTKSEYTRLVTWKPDFRGKKPTKEEIELQKNSSINVALALSYTDAKNFYLAMAASVFSLNPDDTTAANNFAAATASYGDDLELGGSTASAVTKYYEDAQTIYQYALLLTKEKGEFTQAAAKVYIKASATADADGNVALDDVDVVSGVKVTLKKSIVSADIGIEASAVRGTRVYSNLSLDGGNKINSDIKKGMGSWTPKLKKVLWEGKYRMR